MIARIAPFVILAIILTYAYIDHVFWRKRWPWWKRLMPLVWPVFMIYETLSLTFIPDYFPENITWLEAYLLLLVVGVAAPALFALTVFVGRLVKPRRRWAVITFKVASVCLPVVLVVSWCYGEFVGFKQFRVRHVELTFDDLPRGFDGYRIVQFSDAHLGTMIGNRAEILRQAVDSINAQHADMVVFTGDLQNMKPQEDEPHKALLSTIKARDGVFSVLGNHDYTEYVGTKDVFEIAALMGNSLNAHEDMGWKLLCNSRQRIRRADESIIIAGMENDGEGRFPQLGDLNSTLYGVSRSEFVIMLEHDPTSWRRKILPHCHAQLTLSGHTHGGQMALFGWSPASLRYRECAGLYHAGKRMLYVSSGLGGVVPFRLGVPAEIVVFTLRSSK